MPQALASSSTLAASKSQLLALNSSSVASSSMPSAMVSSKMYQQFLP